MRSSLPVLALALVALACSGPAKPAAQGGSAAVSAPSSGATTTKISAFAVSNENLNVDTVGMRDGALRPDGLRDHVFTATVDGPFDALFLVETNQKGEPIYGFRADTVIGGADLPRELGGVVDTGKMTIGVGVVEDGKFVNAESGAATLGPGHHELRLYAPNTNLLVGGDFIRLYAKTPDGSVVGSPVASY
jgi:hypothetical protein